MDKSGIREYQRSIKQLKQEMDLMKQNPNISLIGTTKLRDNHEYLQEEKENNWNYLNQTVNNGDSNYKSNYRSNSKNNCDKQYQSQKYDQSIINIEEKMQSIKQNFIDKKKQEIIQAQNEMDQIMNKMREVEKEENNQLTEKIRKIKERFEENSQKAKSEYEQKLQKFREDMQRDIEKEKERTENSIQQQLKTLESSIKQGNNSFGFSQSLKKYEEDNHSYEPYYNQKVTHISQIKPQIHNAQTHFATQEDTAGKCSSIQSERFTSTKRDTTGRQNMILQQDFSRSYNNNKQQKPHRSRSNSSCSSNSDLDERIFRKSTTPSNNKQLSSNHPIHKLIESNYKMNNKEIFSLIKKYKKINQSYEQPSTHTQQAVLENQHSDNSRQDHLEKNFAISRKLSYQEDPTSSASQTPSGQSNTKQFQFHSQQTQNTSTAQNSLNTSYSNSLIDNFHFTNPNKRKSSNSFHSSLQHQNFVKPPKTNEFYSNNTNKDGSSTFQFKPPLNSRKSSMSQNSNTVTSRLSNNPPTAFNGKFYLSNSLNRRSSNTTAQSKRSITNQMIDSSNDISDDSF